MPLVEGNIDLICECAEVRNFLIVDLEPPPAVGYNPNNWI